TNEIINSIRLTTWKEETAYLEQMVSTLNNISTFLNIILMGIVLVGISNALVMSIRERIYEIGTLRAIGMKRPSVMLMFMLEGLILGLFGSLIGILIGGTISYLLSTYGIYIGASNLSIFLINNTLYLKLSSIMLLLVFAVTIAVSVIASVQPSYKASKLSPTIAMNRE
ncbi:MAG: ABC transporter permease, partial [Spirochaetota bacterium]